MTGENDTALVVSGRDPGGHYRWEAKAARGGMVASGYGFTRWGAERAALRQLRAKMRPPERRERRAAL